MEDIKPKIVLDACVLYPAPVRDILLHLADQDLFFPKWSATIQDEWQRNLLANRPDLTSKKLEKTVNAMNSAFPFAEENDFEELVEEIELPDLDDRHVVALAIKCEAKIILTFNIKDFPKENLDKYEIEAISPDDFICELIKQDESAVKQAIGNQLKFLKNPPLTKTELIENFRICGLEKFAELLKK